MKVIAVGGDPGKTVAYVNGSRVRVGQVVEIEGDTVPKWAEEYHGQTVGVDEDTTGPDTLSGLAALEESRTKLKVARTKLTKARNAFEASPEDQDLLEAMNKAESEVMELEALVEQDGD